MDRSGKDKSIEQSVDVLDIFTDMYVVDNKIETRIESILNSPELKKLVKKVEVHDNVSAMLDDILPDDELKENLSLFQRFTTALKPFYDNDEYNSKKSYLRYLRSVYGFMIHPFEEPPNRILNIFYPSLKNSWEPSPEHSIELLKRFYLETKLIQSLTDKQWHQIYNSGNPEAALVQQLYGIKFNDKFRDFLGQLPWMMAEDYYGAPALDTVYWRAPGPELPKKPLAIEMDFLDKLVEDSKKNRIYRLIVDENGHTSESDKRSTPPEISGRDDVTAVKLTSRNQILKMIDEFGIARIDSYLGLSKRENDFVVFQRIMIWPNPGFERYQNAKKLERLSMTKPSPYLGTIQERAIPLEIPFLRPRVDDKKIGN
jgi:hypothetical protein